MHTRVFNKYLSHEEYSAYCIQQEVDEYSELPDFGPQPDGFVLGRILRYLGSAHPPVCCSKQIRNDK